MAGRDSREHHARPRRRAAGRRRTASRPAACPGAPSPPECARSSRSCTADRRTIADRRRGGVLDPDDALRWSTRAPAVQSTPACLPRPVAGEADALALGTSARQGRPRSWKITIRVRTRSLAARSYANGDHPTDAGACRSGWGGSPRRLSSPHPPRSITARVRKPRPRSGETAFRHSLLAIAADHDPEPPWEKKRRETFATRLLRSLDERGPLCVGHRSTSVADHRWGLTDTPGPWSGSAARSSTRWPTASPY